MAINTDMVILYSILESRLKENPPATLPDLKKYCEKEFKNLTGKLLVITEETLFSDIDNLKSLLEIPVHKSKISGGYYIKDKLVSFLNKVEQSGDSYQLKFKYLFGENANENVYNHVGIHLQTKGWQHLLPISKAIKERRSISFKYKLIDGKMMEIDTIPALLTCINLHWHVITIEKQTEKLETFLLKNIFGGIEYQNVIPAEELPLYFLVNKPFQETPEAKT